MRRTLSLAAACALALSGLAACSNPEAKAREVLEQFLAGWPTGDLAGVSFIDPLSAPVAAADVAAQLESLSGDLAEQAPDLTVAGLSVNDGLGSAAVDVDWPLPGGARWTYQTTVRLAEGNDGWQVIWSPDVLHPELAAGDEMRLRRLPARRGDILDGTGNPLLTAREVVAVGIWPEQVADLEAEVAELEDALHTIDPSVDLSDLPDQVREAEPDQFVPVIRLRREDYDIIRDRIFPLPGTTFQELELHLAPSRTFARALLGTVGDVTAEIIEANPGTYVAGDQVGQGGLSGQHEEQLRGVPGQAVGVARDDLELVRVEPEPGTDLRTTLDPAVQTAAEEALGEVSERAALVAVRVSDGAIVAVANMRGSDAEPVNIALTGQAAPGSTFKMVTGYGLLDTGAVTLDGAVACPAELTIGGFAIGNAFSGDRGEIPFRQAMAISCNTAFAGLAAELGDSGLAAAGSALGLGGDWEIGTDAFTGSVATGGSELDRAQAAFGQGTTAVSPVAMATATAAVARGAWLPPSLVLAPAAENGENGENAEPVPLNPSAITDLQAALRAAITDGTGSALANTPGGEVFGKTGTAETADDDVTHAWFVGWQGDLALAVFVEGGGSGSGTAVPLADRFLRLLA